MIFQPYFNNNVIRNDMLPKIVSNCIRCHGSIPSKIIKHRGRCVKCSLVMIVFITTRITFHALIMIITAAVYTVHCTALTTNYLYTGWHITNATTGTFQWHITYQTELYFKLLGRMFIFQQNYTIAIHFRSGVRL